MYQHMQRFSPDESLNVSNSTCLLSNQPVELQSDIEARTELLYKVVLTFKFLDESQVCDHSNESY